MHINPSSGSKWGPCSSEVATLPTTPLSCPPIIMFSITFIIWRLSSRVIFLSLMSSVWWRIYLGPKEWPHLCFPNNISLVVKKDVKLPLRLFFLNEWSSYKWAVVVSLHFLSNIMYASKNPVLFLWEMICKSDASVRVRKTNNTGLQYSFLAVAYW